MGKILHARLDQESEKTIKRLIQYSGRSQSEIVREALKLLDAVTPRGKKRRIIGLGEFDSGYTDLGSNKKHLEGYGK